MKRNSTTSRKIQCTLTAFFLLFAFQNATAGIAVSPIQQWIDIKPGEKQNVHLNITNTQRTNTTKPKQVTIDAVDFAVDPNGKLLFGEKYTHEKSAVKWINLQNNEFIVKPGETRKIEARLDAPVNADGDYWAAFIVKIGSQNQKKAGVSIKLQTASGIFVRAHRRNYAARGRIIDANVAVSSETNENLILSGQKKSLKINALLENNGRVAYSANGQAIIYDEQKRRVASIALYSRRRRIFPGHSRWFQGVMSQPLTAGKYDMRIFFHAEKIPGRKIIKQLDFTIERPIAENWGNNSTRQKTELLNIKPEQMNISISPGRFTSKAILIKNQSIDTIAVNCRILSHNLPSAWLELRTSNFAISPNNKKNLICLAQLPKNAPQGEYNAKIQIHAKRSGLTNMTEQNNTYEKIPVKIIVSRQPQVP